MTTKSFLFSREPRWNEHRRGAHYRLPDDVQSWVYEIDSLTQRLRHHYGFSVSVTVLLNHWRLPFLSERKQLELPLYRYGLTREVMLHHHGKPLLLARTIIPQQTIKVAHRNLAHLGNRPLGEVIFSYPDLERITMDLTLMPPESWSLSMQLTADIKQPIWGRRTVYAIQQHPLLVSEFFLPEILPY